MKSLVDRLVVAVVTFVLSAIALTIAVHLIESVAFALVVILSLVLLAGLAATAIRQRFDRW